MYVVSAGSVVVYECHSGIELALLQPGQCLSSLLGLVNYLTGIIMMMMVMMMMMMMMMMISQGDRVCIRKWLELARPVTTRW